MLCYTMGEVTNNFNLAIPSSSLDYIPNMHIAHCSINVVERMIRHLKKLSSLNHQSLQSASFEWNEFYQISDLNYDNDGHLAQ